LLQRAVKVLSCHSKKCAEKLQTKNNHDSDKI
jgi:hypothetical protein